MEVDKTAQLFKGVTVIKTTSPHQRKENVINRYVSRLLVSSWIEQSHPLLALMSKATDLEGIESESEQNGRSRHHSDPHQHILRRGTFGATGAHS